MTKTPTPEGTACRRRGRLRLTAISFIASLGVSGCEERTEPAAGDQVIRWRLVEDLRLGSTRGGTPESFGDDLALEVATDGTIYVADQQASRIEVFQSNGDHKMTVGGPGSGPGEFLDLVGLEIDSAGRLWAVDAGNGRFSILSLDGEFEGTIPYQGFRTVPWQGEIDARGRINNLVLTFGARGPQLSFVRPAAEASDTLPLPPYEVTQVALKSPDGLERLATVPFAPRPHWSLDNHGHLWFGTSDKYRIVGIGYGGDTVAVIDRPDRNVPLTADERDHVVEVLRGPLSEDTYVDPSWVPERRPQFESISLDDLNRVWVAVPGNEGSIQYEVFNHDGELVSIAELPNGIKPRSAPVVRAKFVYLVLRDSLDVPFVVRYRLEAYDGAS